MMSENTQRLLQNVDATKQEKFRQRLENLRDEREWSRRTWQRDVDYAKQTIEMVEELLTDVQTEISRLTGQGDHESQIERIKKEFGRRDLEDLESRELGGGYTPTLKDLKEAFERLADLRKRENEWKAYQYEIEKLVREKATGIAEGYQEDFVGSEVAKNTLDKVENHVDSRFETLEQQIHRKIDRKLSKLETALELLRKESEYLRDYHKQLGQVTVESVGEIAESVRSLEELASGDGDGAPESELDGLAGEDGDINLGDADEDLPEPGEGGRGQKQEGVNDQDDEGGESAYKLKNRPLDEKYEELQRLVENEDVENMSQRDIAGLTDVSRHAIFGNGEMLDKVEEQHGSLPGLR